MRAAGEQHLEVTELLIKHGCHKEAKDVCYILSLLSYKM